MKMIYAMIIKDYKLMLRDRTSAFFIFVFPLIFCVFFGSIYGGNDKETATKISIGILDQDNSQTSHTFVKDISALDSITRITEEKPTIENYKQSLKKKKITVFLLIPKGFENSYKEPFGKKPLTVEMIVDPKQPESGMIMTGLLKELASKRLQQIFDINQPIPENTPIAIKNAVAVIKNTVDNSGDSATSKIDFNPIVINKQSLQTKSKPAGLVISLAQSTIWICIGVTVAFISFIGIESTSGNLLRLSLSPFTKFQFLAAKGLGAFLIQFALMAVFFVGTFLISSFSPNIIGVIVCMCATAFAFSGFMLGASALLDIRSTSAPGIVNSILLLLSMIGGAMIPLIAMPQWMISISQFTPIYHAVYSLEGVVWRGLSLSDVAVSIAVLIAVGIIGLSIGMMKFRYTNKQ